MKECVAEPNLRLFFERLLELKLWVKTQADDSNSMMLHEIHKRLHDIIKEAK